ncbi:MAG: class I SAM-dependent methyltransferase [Candidatus Hydrogenedentota bacterium]
MDGTVLSRLLKRRNPAYIGARLVRRMLPEFVAHRLLSKRHLAPKDIYESMSRTYTNAIKQAGLVELFGPAASLTVLEAGTGFYNPATAPLLLSGVRRLILLEPFIGPNPDYARFRERFDSLLRFAREDPEYPLPRNDALLTAAGSNGLPGGIELSRHLWENTGLPSNSIDGVFSASVLEHLRDPDAVLRECGRILKPGGFMVNAIDLRDHFFRYPFEMLKYSRAGWKLLTTGSGGSGYQNRWRIGHWFDALARHGFESTVVRSSEFQELAERERPYFDPEFRGLPIEQLRVLGALVISRRAV